MIVWDDDALILSYIKFSESSLILRVFTKNHGVQKGLVRGAKSKKNANIFEAGNFINISYKARTEEMLGVFKVELIRPSPLIYLKDTNKFSCIITILNLLEFCLLENEVENSLYNYTDGLINNIYSYKTDWVQEYIKWEIYLLKKVGFGLELSKCVLSNKTENLKYISPKSGCAVNSEEGKRWNKKLLILPSFLISTGNANKEELINGFKITTMFLKKFSASINKTLPFTRGNFIDNILNSEITQL